MIFHGTVFLLIGLLAGFPYGRSLAHGAGERRAEAWRAAHTGLIGTGVLTIVLGLALQLWAESGGLAALVRHAALVAGYGFVVAMSLAAATGERGLAPGGTAVNRLVFGCYVVSILGTLIGVLAFLGLAWAHR